MNRFLLLLPFILLAAAIITVYLDNRGSASTQHGDAPTVSTDPVCHMEVGPKLSASHDDVDYYFCADRCVELFVENPPKYIAETCVVCRASSIHTAVTDSAHAATWQGETYYLCSAEHRSAFRADPSGYFMHTMWGIPPWLYYASIAGILLATFGTFELPGRQLLRRDPGATLRNPTAFEIDRTDRPRVDLLSNAAVRRIAVHPFTRFAARAVMVALFLFIIYAGLFGSQLPGKNIAPLLVWTVWWGGLILVILYAGAAWCYVCPWQAVAEWSERLQFWGVRKRQLGLGVKWPRMMRNVWPAIVLFAALTWIELGLSVTFNPRATAYFAIGFAGLAFVSAFVFDRASFCRYACFVGRIIGIYSLFSPVEVRARSLDACRTCSTKSCYRGNDQGDPCPTYQYLPGMEQNTNCITCLECAKSCEKENVSLSLRPWGEDLRRVFRPRSDEAALALFLVALTGFHGFTMTARWTALVEGIQDAFGIGYMAAFSLGMAGLTALPIAIYALLVALSWGWARQRDTGYGGYFTRYAYSLLPIALFYHLAHNSEHILLESQKIVPLASDPLGRGWDLFNTASISMAPLVSLPTLWLIQVALVLIGHVYSLAFGHRVARDLFDTRAGRLRSQLPMLAAMVLFSLASLWLLKQPMQMRVSAM